MASDANDGSTSPSRAVTTARVSDMIAADPSVKPNSYPASRANRSSRTRAAPNG